jgi:hypothetical protein
MSKSLTCALAAAIMAATLGVASAQQGQTRQIQVLPAPGAAAAAPDPGPDAANANAAPQEPAAAPQRRRPGRPVQQAAPAPDAGPPQGDSTAGAPPPGDAAPGAPPPPAKGAPQKFVKEGPELIEKKPVVKHKPKPRYYGEYQRPRYYDRGHYGGGGYGGGGYGGGGYGGGGYGGGGYGRY